MPKRVSNSQEKEIIERFINGQSIDEIAICLKFTKITISKKIKKSLGEERFKKIYKRNKSSSIPSHSDEIKNKADNENNIIKEKILLENNFDDYFQENIIDSSSFVEIKPLAETVDETSRKDLSSLPLDDVEFPKIVFMIVNNKVELEVKLLKEFPEWNYLPSDDLERKSIEIFHELKTAKKICKKEQKVIKVPNSNVFRIVAPILVARGISRIISKDILIAL